MPRADLDLSDLDPGVRRTVAWLRSRGYETTDSGDGRSKLAALRHMRLRGERMPDAGLTAEEAVRFKMRLGELTQAAWVDRTGTHEEWEHEALIHGGDILPFPHVHMRAERWDLCSAAARLYYAVLRCTGRRLDPGQIQAVYDPADEVSTISLYHFDDTMLPEDQ